MIEDAVIAEQLKVLLMPAITSQKGCYRELGLRNRILTLPLMVAAVITMLWRDVAGISELTRMLVREGFLWCSPGEVSQQAMSERFLTFPSGMFEKVFKLTFSRLFKTKNNIGEKKSQETAKSNSVYQ
jgi:hypothetical protein